MKRLKIYLNEKFQKIDFKHDIVNLTTSQVIEKVFAKKMKKRDQDVNFWQNPSNPEDMRIYIKRQKEYEKLTVEQWEKFRKKVNEYFEKMKKDLDFPNDFMFEFLDDFEEKYIKDFEKMI